MLIEIPDTTPLVPLARALAGVGITLQLHETVYRGASKQGDCDLCGRWSGHLIGGVCTPCLNRNNQTGERR